MSSKSRQVLSMFRWITGFLGCYSSNSSPYRELCRGRSQIRDCLHRGRSQLRSEPSQVQSSVGYHVSLWFFFSLQHSRRDRTGHHSSRSDRQNNFLIRGFGPDGHAHHTIHAHSLQTSKYFANGGKKFAVGRGSKTLDLEAECEVLVCVFSLRSFQTLT